MADNELAIQKNVEWEDLINLFVEPLIAHDRMKVRFFHSKIVWLDCTVKVPPPNTGLRQGDTLAKVEFRWNHSPLIAYLFRTEEDKDDPIVCQFQTTWAKK